MAHGLVLFDALAARQAPEVLVDLDGEVGPQPLVAGARALDGVAGFVEGPRFYPYLGGRKNLELLAAYDRLGATRAELHAPESGCLHDDSEAIAIPDLIEEMAVSTIRDGGHVEAVADPPGGVAALLRYPLAPPAR